MEIIKGYEKMSEDRAIALIELEKYIDNYQFEVVDDGEVYVFDKDRMQYRRVK